MLTARLVESDPMARGDGSTAVPGAMPWASAAASRWRRFVGAQLPLACATALAFAFDRLGLADTNLALAFLLGVAATAAWYGRGPAVYAAFASVLLFNFLFTEPHYTFVVDDTQYLFTFAVMLGIGLLVSTLTARVRAQSEAARVRERRAEATYRFSRRLSATTRREEIVAAAREELAELLGVEAAVVLADAEGRVDAGAALAGGDVLRLRLAGAEGALGELRVRAPDTGSGSAPDQRRLLETCAALVALALERERQGDKARRALVQAEAEELRSALLSSVSHDLRTPLAVVAGASSSLIEAGEDLAEAERRELYQTIFQEADRLSRLVENLLHMTRLESGRPSLRKEWNLVEDLVGSALTRASRSLERHRVAVEVGERLPLVRVDGVLVELALINLLDNAAKYAPAGTEIALSAACDGARVTIDVLDRGPGLGEEDLAHLFEKFYRGAARGSGGAGLGLAICRAIAELHGGAIEASNRPGGGARLRLALPLEEQPPALGGVAEEELA